MRLSHAKNPATSDTLRKSDELERFKTAINLTEYAASEGYQLDRRASSRNSVVMRHPGGDKIVIARGEDGHWVYFSVRDDSDKDEDSAGFAAIIEGMVSETGSGDLAAERAAPAEAKDWNDVLLRASGVVPAIG